MGVDPIRNAGRIRAQVRHICQVRVWDYYLFINRPFSRPTRMINSAVYKLLKDFRLTSTDLDDPQLLGPASPSVTSAIERLRLNCIWCGRHVAHVSGARPETA